MATERSTMDARTKFIIVNVSIVAGLLFEVYRGAPVVAIVISGLLLFALANVLMVWKYKGQSSS